MGSSWWSKIGSRFSISIESGAGDLHQSGGIPHKTAASFLKGISFVTFTGNCASADIQLAWYMAEHLVPEWTSRMAGVGGQCWSNLIKAFAAALHSRHSQGKWKLCIWVLLNNWNPCNKIMHVFDCYCDMLGKCCSLPGAFPVHSIAPVAEKSPHLPNAMHSIIFSLTQEAKGYRILDSTHARVFLFRKKWLY